jgi:hypothetical protein
MFGMLNLYCSYQKCTRDLTVTPLSVVYSVALGYTAARIAMRSAVLISRAAYACAHMCTTVHALLLLLLQQVCGGSDTCTSNSTTDNNNNNTADDAAVRLRAGMCAHTITLAIQRTT